MLATTAMPIEETVESECLDLSRGGAGLRMGRDVAVGAPVRLMLRLKRQPPLTVQGTIAWIRPHPDFPGWAVGVQFHEELDGELVAEIANGEYPPWERGGD